MKLECNNVACNIFHAAGTQPRSELQDQLMAAIARRKNAADDEDDDDDDDDDLDTDGDYTSTDAQ